MLVLMLAQAAEPTFTLAQARAMTPVELADAMLEKDHPPIRATIVHPVGMDAPATSLLNVTLTGVPGPAPERGWCRQVDWWVRLAPVDRVANPYTTATPTRVVGRERVERYRRAIGRCDDPKSTFFTIRAAGKTDQLAFVERMLAVRRLAAGKRRLPFALECRDDDGARYASFGGNRCGRDDGRTLLANLAVERAFNVTAAGTSTVYTISSATGSSGPTNVPRPATLGTTDGALVVDVEVSTAADGSITAIELRRHIPYPF